MEHTTKPITKKRSPSGGRFLIFKALVITGVFLFEVIMSNLKHKRRADVK